MLTRPLPSTRLSSAWLGRAIVLLAMISAPLSAQWKPTGGPVTRPIRDIEFFGDSVFAIDVNLRNMHPDSNSWVPVGFTQNKFFDGIEPVGDTLYGYELGNAYISTDGGTYWPRIQDIPGIGAIHALEHLQPAIFFGGELGIVRSTNNGATWVESNTGLANRSVLAFGEIGSVVLAGTREGIYYSTSGGATWTRTAGVPERTDPFHAFATLDSVVVAATGAEVYRSLDSGRTWTPSSAGLPSGDTVNALIAAGGMIFAGTDTNGVYLSGDHGLTWALSGLDTLGITTFAERDGQVFAGTGTMGIFRSLDSGASWQEARNGVGTGDNVIDLASSAGVLYAASRVAFVSRDSGDFWRPSQTARDVSFKALEPAPAGAYLLASTGDSSLVYASSGDEWVPLPVALVGRNATRLLLHRNRIFVVNNGVFRYDTTAWTEVSPPTTPVSVATEIASVDTFLFAAGAQGVYRSSDLGATWTSVSTNLPVPLAPTRMISNDSTLYLTDVDYLYHSTDLGETWTGSTGLLRGTVTDMAFDNDTIYLSVRGGSTSSVKRSTNLGGTWTNVIEGIERLEYTSTFNALAILDSRLYLATSRAGVWSRPLSEMSGTTTRVAVSRVADAFAMSVAPNPASTTATIIVDPAAATTLDVELFDQMGRSVLKNPSLRTNAGRTAIVLDLRDLPSGSYRCVVRTDDAIVTRSIVVVR